MAMKKIDTQAALDEHIARRGGRGRQTIAFPEASLTKQADGPGVNLNTIMAKYQRTGIEPVQKNLPNYGDFSARTTLHEALNLVRESENAFAALPSAIRDAVHNDPGELLDLVSDPEQRSRAIELGLIMPSAAEEAAASALAAKAAESGENSPVNEEPES